MEIDRRAGFLLLIVLGVAGVFRLRDLVSHAYVLDEDWSAEIATGRGSVHQHVPTDRIIDAPLFFSIADAPPWWHIWSNMEVTHPPLYPLLLRAWLEVTGDSDYAGRLFSVVFSMVAVALMFDTVRLQIGLAGGFWAGLMMAVATSQVEHARLTRSYALLTAAAMLAANLVVRIRHLGWTPMRGLVLGLAVFGTLMTHYFALGAMLGLGVWAILQPAEIRKRLVLSLLVAGGSFLTLWGPWIWRQRHLFATDDPSTLFLSDSSAHHLQDTLIRMLIDPVSMLLPIQSSGIAAMIAATAGAVILILGILPAVKRHNAPSLLWGCWLFGTIAVVAALDVSRGTSHLKYVRYTILAGPAVFALLPTAFASPANLAKPAGVSWFGHLICALAVGFCLYALPSLYLHDDPDPRNIARDFALLKPGSSDVLMYASDPSQTTICDLELFMLARYMQPMRCKVAVLTRPADPAMLRDLSHCRFVFLNIQAGDFDHWIPGATLIKGRTYRDLGNVFVLRPNQTQQPYTAGK